MIFQYEGIYNFPQRVFDKAVEAVEVEGESEAESEREEAQEKELEKEVEMELEVEREIEQGGLEYVEADSDDDYDDDDIEELSMVNTKTLIIRRNITSFL